MPTPSIDRPGKTLALADIERVEHLLHARLPGDYVAFLLRHNGGVPTPDGFYDAAGKFEDGVQVFHRIDGEAHDDLVKNAQFFHQHHDLASDLIPIARTGSGDLVCVGIGERNRGHVVFWSHDAPDRADSTWTLAADLASFLETFHE